MDIDLISNDMNNFIKKYTRFMSKDIYITSIFYDRFVNNYKYLYDEVKKNIYLYKDSSNYKKMMSIILNKDKLIKFHNKKYLDNKVKDIDNSSDLNINKLLYLEEDKLLVINNKYIDIINCMFSRYKDNLLVIADDKKLVDKMSGYLYSNLVYDIESLGYKVLGDGYIFINKSDKYEIISYYIKNILYKNKYKFRLFCRAFWDDLYFNKDYLDYDTFRDYHNYMFKRMFLKSEKDINSFNKSSINKRREYLRSINDEVLPNVNLVDIANFLFLNSIDYKYDYKNELFYIYNGDISDKIRYKDEDDLGEDEFVIYRSYLDKSTPLEHLAYELIKRRYPMERISDIDIYNRLKDTCEDGYFSKCLDNIIIPIIDKYNDYIKDFDNNKKEVIRDIYSYYKNYLDSNNMLDRGSMINLINDKIRDNYIILLEDYRCNLSKYKLNNNMIINYNYKNEYMNNIKDKHNYEVFLNDKKKIPVNNVYTSYNEVYDIIKKYIKINNYKIDYKRVYIKYYHDEKRLMNYKNKLLSIKDFIDNLKGSILIIGNSYNDMTLIFNDNNFRFISKNKIIYNNKNIDLITYKDDFDKLYDYIIIDNILDKKYNIKKIINKYMNKCKKKIILIIGSSKKGYIDYYL